MSRAHLTCAARFCAARLDWDSSRFAFRPSGEPSRSMSRGGEVGGAGARDALGAGAGAGPGLWPEGGAMGIMLGVGAPRLGGPRRSGWICASASVLVAMARAASCEAAARWSYPFAGRDDGECDEAALVSREPGADEGSASWFCKSSSCARKCCSAQEVGVCQ